MRWMERSRCVAEGFTLAKARLMFLITIHGIGYNRSQMEDQ